MAISTSTEALIALQKNKIKNDIKQKEQVEYTRNGFSIDLGADGRFDFPAVSEILTWYDDPIEKIDNRIYEINVQIVDLQNQILAVGQSANICGCGGSVGFGTTGVPFFSGINTVTVYADTVTYRGWSYTSPNPFDAINGTLSPSNAGIGTETLTGISSIGIYYGDVGIARTNIALFPICPGITTCDSYPIQIAALESQITPLRNERNSLISKVNYLKSERSKYKIRDYGFTAQLETLNSEISSAESLIDFLESPSNEEWL
jgi:hypothetical protein